MRRLSRRSRAAAKAGISCPAQTSVNGFNKRLCRPLPCRRAVTAVVIASRAGRLYLRERHTLRDQILDAVANDGEHVPILDDVSFIGETPVPGNHVGAGFGLVLRDG